MTHFDCVNNLLLKNKPSHVKVVLNQYDEMEIA